VNSVDLSTLLRENIAVVSLTSAYNYSSELIHFEEKIWFISQIKAGVMLSICLIFHQKTGLV